jgi:signal transduction histidine kinase
VTSAATPGPDEFARLAALRALGVLDSAPEAEFDALVRAAALVCEVPISLITLVDSDRQWFKAHVGLPGVKQTPRDVAFCAHAVLSPELMEVPDARLDPRFSDNPLVTGAPDIRFYAGAPIQLSDGSRVGTLCVVDREPRQLDGRQRDVLQQLAVVASQALQGRQAAAEDLAERKLAQAFLDRTGRVAGVGGWEVDLRTEVLTWSQQTHRIHEVEPGFVPDVATAIGFYAEAARPVIAAAVQAGMVHGTPWDLELPLVTAQGQAIWVRSQGDVEFEDGRPVRLIGAIQNVTEQRRRRLELQQEHELRVQLEAQMQQTERLLRERSEMLDVMAHEVRQPLNNASAAMQSAALALGGLSDQSATPRLQRAQAVLAQVLASIDNTLAVAALLARPDPIARADTDIDALLSVAVADISLPQRLRIRIERHTRTRTASMDMSLMRLALRNLLNNALQHSPPDADVVLRVADSDEPLALLLDVVDAGSGIAADLVPRLFERAIHKGRLRAPLGQGHGLGLYIVRRVMELHAGAVQLQANSLQGVTMRLVINQPHGD